jgi:energy-coupling factor transporter transmembrane protein EcfT
MIGSIRWNFALGIFGFFFSFILSIINNIFTTALINGLYSGIILFIVAFIVRWFFGAVFQTAAAENHIGNKFDLITPDESDEIHQLLRNENDKEIEQSDFVPLNPPKLASKSNVDPEEMVKALRHMSED